MDIEARPLHHKKTREVRQHSRPCQTSTRKELGLLVLPYKSCFEDARASYERAGGPALCDQEGSRIWHAVNLEMRRDEIFVRELDLKPRGGQFAKPSGLHCCTTRASFWQANQRHGINTSPTCPEHHRNPLAARSITEILLQLDRSHEMESR